jgi:hypothetical protein
MTQCWDPLPQHRPSMEEVHDRMKALCDFFPEAEPLNMDESYDDETSNIDTYDFDSIPWPTEQTDMPQIRVSANTHDSSFQNTARTPTAQQYLLNVSSADARWSSGDSGNPKIVSSEPPMVRSLGGGGGMMTPLNIDVDPNAWDLKHHELQRLVGGE